MKKIKLQYSGLITALLYSLTIFSLSISHVSLADDTETLVGAGGLGWATPNVLFIIDTSGSMAWDKSCTSNCSDLADTDPDQKLYIVKHAYTKLMNDFSGINVALMRFDGRTSQNGGTNNNHGGYFISPMQELDSTNRSSIISAASSLTAQGRTPLAETLYEAARYYRGMSVDFGDSTIPGTNVSGVLDPSNTSNYESPVLSQCQANYVILLTDGEPKMDYDADNSIPNLPGYNSGSCSFNSGNDCLDEVADYMHNVDISSIHGMQSVSTYTIGFTTNQQLLQDTASKGGGSYIQASDATSLEAAFTTILKTVVNANNSFSPPAIAANAFNSVSDYNVLYFTLFEPAAKPKWDGNIKPYTLSGDPPEVTDAAGVAAITAQGFFKDTSRSFWSTTADGDSIAAGGANGNLPAAANRNLYTFTGTYTNGVPDSSGTSFPTLSNPNNALKNAPSSELTAAMLGLSDPDPVALDAKFTSVIDTIRSDTLGDPLHSKPALVNYGGSANSPDLTLFAATNAGFLHAINATTGVEQFGFIPQELLQQLPGLTQNTGSHLYGLDGDVTAWVEDNNNNGIIEKANNDHVYVYVGMRRGGNSRSNNYYALDVTDRSKPVLKWVIKGGSGNFAELGQTWSRPEVTTIKYGSGTKTVLIFGGGYDKAEDNNPVYQPDSIGRAIYIVDADTGQRLWWAGPFGSGADIEMTSMTNSIPSDVRLLDSSLDGNTDRLYVGDMGGHIFRIDLQATNTAVSGSGILLASLGATSITDAANNRRFYYPPDVVVTRQTGATPYISVNIGSGYRAHPLNPNSGTIVHDRFYSLRDPNVLGAAPNNFVAISDCASCSDLFDATTDLVTTNASKTSLANSKGWFITLTGNGEKVLAPSVTVNGEIFFTSYIPPSNVIRNDCAPPPGTGKLYRVSLFDATPSPDVVGVDSNGDPNTPIVEDRSQDIKRPGIPSEPAIMFRKTASGVEIDQCVGTECKHLPGAIKMEETYWRDNG